MDLLRSYTKDDVSDDLAIDILNNFAQNSNKMAARSPQFWIPRPVVELIMAIGKELTIDDHAKYQAIHLYDKFVVKHIEDVRKEYLDTYKKSHEHEWSVVFNRLCDQFLFRVITCLSICSKLESVQTIPKSQWNAIINKFKLKQTINDLLKSELRVMSTVNYDIREDTLLDFAEFLLYVIVRNDETLDPSRYVEKLVLIIDFVYLHREQLKLVLTEKIGETEAREMLLLSSAVIATISVLLNDGNEAKIIRRLNEATAIEELKIMIVKNKIIIMIINRILP